MRLQRELKKSEYIQVRKIITGTIIIIQLINTIFT